MSVKCPSLCRWLGPVISPVRGEDNVILLQSDCTHPSSEQDMFSTFLFVHLN